MKFKLALWCLLGRPVMYKFAISGGTVASLAKNGIADSCNFKKCIFPQRINDKGGNTGLAEMPDGYRDDVMP